MSSISISYEQSGVPEHVLRQKFTDLMPEIDRLCAVQKDGYLAPESFVQLARDEQLRTLVHELVARMRPIAPRVFVLIGIGGSNVGMLAVFQALRGKLYNMLRPDIELYCADTVDSDALGDLVRVLEDHFERGHEIIINVVSKSGTTIETAAHVHLLLDLLKKYKGIAYHQSVVVTTDHGSALWNLAHQQQFACLEIPKVVGGRFSVLSAVGLFPLAFLGVDINALCEGARSMIPDFFSDNLYQNHAATLAAVSAYQYQQGLRIANSFFFSVDLELTGAWYRQLIGESLGKQNNAGQLVGIMPVVSIGSTDLHSVGQLYLGGPRTTYTTFVSVAHTVSDVQIPYSKTFSAYMPLVQKKSYTQLMDAILSGTKKAYTTAQLPYISIELPEKNAYYMGQFLQLQMMHVVYLGYLLRVNPFDQPQVELYKQETRKILQHE